MMIIGAGKFGYRLAEAMVQESMQVTMIDREAGPLECVLEIYGKGTGTENTIKTVTGNGLDLDLLRSLEVDQYDLLVAATSNDETNTIGCFLGKKLGVKKTVARIRNPENVRLREYLMTDMKIDLIVNPDLATAQEMTRFLMKGYHFNSGEFAKGKIIMMDIHIHQMRSLVGKKIREIVNFEGLLITAIRRDGEILIPNGDTVLGESDQLFIMGRTQRLNEMVKRYRLSLDVRPVNKVMIFGGGKVAYFLAKQLIRLNVKVIIIEQDRERCMYLSTTLPDAIVIHGDGTDMRLLDDESLPDMDAFVGATGYDEHNLLMALMAKQEGVGLTIAKLQKSGYIKLIDKLKIDFALSPIELSISEIMKYARGGQIVAVTMLLEGQAEVVEVIIHEDLDCVDKKVKDLNLPKGLIIGAMMHNQQAIIPNGNTVLQIGDRLVIFCLNTNLAALQQFISPNDNGLLRHLRVNDPGRNEVMQQKIPPRPAVSFSRSISDSGIEDMSQE